MNDSKLALADYPAEEARKAGSLLLVFLAIPIVFQGALLHPKFATWRILRWVRLGLTPFSVYLALKGPVEYCFYPINKRGGFNFSLCIWGIQAAMKSIQYGLIDNYFEGKMWIRKEAAVTVDDQSYTPESNQKTEYSWLEVARWSLRQTFSPRGLQFGWGLKQDLNDRPVLGVIKRLYKVHLLSLCATAFGVACRDLGSPTNVLLALKFPNTTATKIFAEMLYSFSFPAFLLSWFDLAYDYLTLFAYLITWIHRRRGLPVWVMEWFDSRLYPNIFGSPHTVKSLGDLWSKAWHQFLRADLIFFGARPAIYLAKRIGLSKAGQKISSLFAVFFISGLLHEIYIYSTVTTKVSFERYLSTLYPFPGAMFYFMIQPVGILLEQFFKPLIPSFIGGGAVWVWLFSLIVIIPYRNVLLSDIGILDESCPPLSQWPLYAFFIPGTLYRL